MWLEGVNAVFEATGALLAWRNVQHVRVERPSGVSPALIAFSALWAVECIPYYLAHGDWLSTVGAAARCLANVVWCALAWTWRVERPQVAS